MKAWIVTPGDTICYEGASLVYALSEGDAKSIVASQSSGECRNLKVRRYKAADKYFKGVDGYIETDVSTLRDLLWYSPEGHICISCGRDDFGKPEWSVCSECECCKECGHDEDCPQLLSGDIS